MRSARKQPGRFVADDQDLIAQVNSLATEQHGLFERQSWGEAGEADRDRLRTLAVELEQLWDLVRQRRARRAAGLDPDGAAVRDELTVKRYLG